MFKVLKTNGVPVALVLLGLLVLILVPLRRARQERLDTAGTVVPGSLVKGETRQSRKGGTTYKLYFSFQARDGRYERDMDVPEKFYDAHIDSRGRVTDRKVEIRYNPSDMKEVEIVGASSRAVSEHFVLYMLGGGLLLASGVGYFLFLKRRYDLQSR